MNTAAGGALTAATRDALFTVQREELVCYVRRPGMEFFEVARVPIFPKSTGLLGETTESVPQRLERAGSFLFLEMSDGSVLVHVIADPARLRFVGRLLPRLSVRTVLDPIGESEIGVSGCALSLSSAGRGIPRARPNVIAPLSDPVLLAGLGGADEGNRDRKTLSPSGFSPAGWGGLPDFDSDSAMIASALGAEGSWYLAGDTTISWPAGSSRFGIGAGGAGASNRERGVERAREGPSSTAARRPYNAIEESPPEIAGNRLVAYHSVTGRMVR